MARLEEDGSFELQQKKWTELIELRQAMADHGMDPAGVELAISNVFDLKKGPVIDSMIRDGKELMAMILRLEELQIDSSNVKMALEKAFIPGMSGAYDADLFRLKEMIKMREEMAKIGIPTGCIEATIAEKAFQVSRFNCGVEDITDGLSHGHTLRIMSSLNITLKLLIPSHVHYRRRSTSQQSSMLVIPLSLSVRT